MSRHREGEWWHIPILQEVLKCYPEPRTYIEIGLDKAKCFNEMLGLAECYGCDVDQRAWEHVQVGGWFYHGTSDDFFRDYEGASPCLVFIDGDHSYNQTLEDFKNAESVLSSKGTIAIHDTYPLGDTEACGDVYKMRTYLAENEYESYTFMTWPGLTLVNT